MAWRLGGNPFIRQVATCTPIFQNFGTYCASVEIWLSKRQKKPDLALQCTVTREQWLTVRRPLPLYDLQFLYVTHVIVT